MLKLLFEKRHQINDSSISQEVNRKLVNENYPYTYSIKMIIIQNVG